VTTELWTLAQASVQSVGDTSATVLDEIMNFHPSAGIRQILLGSDGDVDNTFLGVMSQDARVSFTSLKLATLLGLNSSLFLLAGKPITADDSHAGLTMYLQKMLQGGTRDATSAHKSLNVKLGMMLPRSLSAQQGGHAQLEIEVIPVYDGTNSPIVIASGVALPAATVIAELFTLGPVKISGTSLEGVQSVRISPNIREVLLSSDGGIWPTFGGIMSRGPGIALQTTKASCISTFGLSGAALASTTVIYFRMKDPGALNVANATATHISVTLVDGMVFWEELPITQNGHAMAAVVIQPRKGSSAVMAVNPATAIT
jgi:hypothetical protein